MPSLQDLEARIDKLERACVSKDQLISVLAYVLCTRQPLQHLKVNENTGFRDVLPEDFPKFTQNKVVLRTALEHHLFPSFPPLKVR
jgi:hypothetical protein